MTNLLLNLEYIFGIVMFFNRGWVLKVGAPSKYYKGVQLKKEDFEWIGLLSDLISMSARKIKIKIQNSTLNWSFDTLSKWHDPHIRKKIRLLLPKKLKRFYTKELETTESYMQLSKVLKIYLSVRWGLIF